MLSERGRAREAARERRALEAAEAARVAATIVAEQHRAELELARRTRWESMSEAERDEMRRVEREMELARVRR